jgi:hypothetical protein
MLRWHGDVKPDNILLVQKEWKLADFGFAEFTERVGETGSLPKADMRGGTETYGMDQSIISILSLMLTCCTGAPESARTRFQTIDTWSFGCVLSVTATWIVTGSSGVEEFEALRKLACTTRKLAKITDAFHDGDDVFPEIKHWHNHLKEVMRKSDFITSEILDLVDKEMLIKKPEDRLSSKDLCEKLDSIIEEAEARQQRQQELELAGENGLPETHDSVKVALLSTEKDRTSMKSGEREAQSIRYVQVDNHNGDGQHLKVSLTPSGLHSNRSSKAKKMEYPHPNTPQRLETLERDLTKRGVAVSAVSEKDPLLSSIAKGKQRVPEIVDSSRPSSRQSSRPTSRQSSRPSSRQSSRPPSFQKLHRNDPQQSRQVRIPELILTPVINGPADRQDLAGQSTPQQPLTPARIPSSITSQQPPPQILSQTANQDVQNLLESPPEPRPQPPQHRTLQPNPPTVRKTNQVMSPTLAVSPSARPDIFKPDEIWDAVKEEGVSATSWCKAILKENKTRALDINQDGYTPIIIAAQDNNIDMVNLLVDYSFILHRDREGKTVLHHAILGLAQHARLETGIGFLGVIRKILHRGKADLVNILDDNRCSPLYYCVEQNMLETAKILVGAGAWINPPAKSPGRDVFIEAAKRGTPNMVKFFLANGAVSDPRLATSKEIASESVRRLLKPNGKDKERSSNGGGFFGKKSNKGFLNTLRSKKEEVKEES